MSQVVRWARWNWPALMWIGLSLASMAMSDWTIEHQRARADAAEPQVSRTLPAVSPALPEGGVAV